MGRVFDFVQTSCVIIVLSYLLSRANFFYHIQEKKLTKGKFAITAIIFICVALYGTAIRSLLISEMYVDTRMVGVCLSSLMFGGEMALAVLLPVLIATYVLGGITVYADMAALVLAVIVCTVCRKRFAALDAVLYGIIAGALEVVHILIIVFAVKPVEAAKEFIYTASFPMIVVNGCAVIAFVFIITDINDRHDLWEKETFSRSEFAMAKKIQTSLLETKFGTSEKLDLDAYLEPAFDVGGDLYSFYIDKGRYFKFIIGDVSGKGVPAAIMMSRCCTLFQEVAHYTDDPADTLDALNSRLCKHNDAMMFVTAFMGVLDLENGTLLYSNAGHTHPYIIEAGKEALRMELPSGKPLGVFENSSYSQACVKLNDKQRIFAYTDGVSEAENASRTNFEESGIVNALSGLEKIDAGIINRRIMESVRAHAKGTEQSDDITLMSFGLKTDGKAEQIQ